MDAPAPFMDTHLHQPFLSLVAQRHVAAYEQHVGSASLGAAAQPDLSVREDDVLPDELFETRLLQVRHSYLAVDNGNLPGGKLDETVQEGASIKQGRLFGTQPHLFGKIEPGGQVERKQGQQFLGLLLDQAAVFCEQFGGKGQEFGIRHRIHIPKSS